jgi:hypothetical protein
MLTPFSSMDHFLSEFYYPTASYVGVFNVFLKWLIPWDFVYSPDIFNRFLDAQVNVVITNPLNKFSIF